MWLCICLFMAGLFVFLGTLLLANASIDASRVLHSKLLNNMLRVPMVFFDTTPIGRVVNRFAKVGIIIYLRPPFFPFFFHFFLLSEVLNYIFLKL